LNLWLADECETLGSLAGAMDGMFDQMRSGNKMELQVRLDHLYCNLYCSLWAMGDFTLILCLTGWCILLSRAFGHLSHVDTC
jgi:hypothetical protein